DLPALLAAAEANMARLVHVKGLKLADPTKWPPVDQKAKGLELNDAAGGDAKVFLTIYVESGVPGAAAPADGFTLTGLLRRSNDDIEIFARALSDFNPVADKLAGKIAVAKADDAAFACEVDLANIGAFNNATATAVLVADVITPACILDPESYEYQLVGEDGYKNPEPLSLLELRRTMLVADADTGKPKTSYLEALGMAGNQKVKDVVSIIAAKPTK
ncbi:MAG: hypothetical protein ABIH03_11355, partial [Pseudomonadota bacterium]